MRVEHHLHGHQLGERGRRDQLVGVLREQDRAGLGVDHEGLRGLRLEELRLRLRRRRWRQRQINASAMTSENARAAMKTRCPAIGAAEVLNISLSARRSTADQPEVEKSRRVMRRNGAAAGQSRMVIASGAPFAQAASSRSSSDVAAVGVEVDAVPDGAVDLGLLDLGPAEGGKRLGQPCRLVGFA